MDANTNISNHYTHTLSLWHNFLTNLWRQTPILHTYRHTYVRTQPKTIKPIEWHWMRMTVRTFIHVYFLFFFFPYQHTSLPAYEILPNAKNNHRKLNHWIQFKILTCSLNSKNVRNSLKIFEYFWIFEELRHRSRVSSSNGF